MRRLAIVVTLAACGGGAPASPTRPTSPPPRKEHVAPAPVPTRLRVADLVQPVEVAPDAPGAGHYESGEEGGYPDEPVATCVDPHEAFGVVGVRGAPPEDYAERGWVQVDEPIFRQGCIEPGFLRDELQMRERDLVDCFLAATTAEWLALRARVTFPESARHSYRDVTVELRFPSRPKWERTDEPEPVVDTATLTTCIANVLSEIGYLGREPQLPAIVDLPLERGYPSEGGGVVGGP